MRIGIFTDDYYPRRSGVVTSVYYLAKGLRERGHQVYIIAPRYPNYHDEDKDVIRIPSVKAVVVKNVRAAIPRSKILRQILELDLDIVHSTSQYNVGVIGDYIARKCGVPHVTTAHTILPELAEYYPAQAFAGYALTSQLYQLYFNQSVKYSLPSFVDIQMSKRRSLALLKQQLWNMQNIFLNNTTKVITPSNYMLDLLKTHGLTANSATVHNGIDVSFFGKPRKRQFYDKNCLRIVIVGRLSAEKRQSEVIKAVSSIPNVELHIIGDGPDKNDLRRQIKQLHLKERVFLHGPLNSVDVRDQMLQADCLLLASYNFDSQGVVLLEAAATGLPVIYCDSKLSESTDSNGSILVSPSPAGIRKGLNQAIANPALLQLMSISNKQFAKQFDYSSFADQSIQIYKRLISI